MRKPTTMSPTDSIAIDHSEPAAAVFKVCWLLPVSARIAGWTLAAVRPCRADLTIPLGTNPLGPGRQRPPKGRHKRL